MRSARNFLSYQGARARAFGKRRAPRWIKARIWSWEFKAGRWDYLDNSEGSPIYPILARLLSGGRLLDIGCGSGTVRCELPHESLIRYVGVDISAEAIGRARERTAGRPPIPEGQRFLTASIEDRSVIDELDEHFDVILFNESLYFVDLDKVVRLLMDLTTLLDEHGVVVVKIHDRDRYRAHVSAVREALDVVEEHVQTTSTAITLVGPPHRRHPDREIARPAQLGQTGCQ